MINTRPNLILIVDDNPTNARMLVDFLEDSGFRVLVAKSGESALSKLQAVSPDLILLDVMMPGIDGFETCRRLKAKESTRDIPIIFMTALTNQAHRVKGLSIGAVDYITKPFQQEEVLARVNIHLKLHNLNKELEQRVAERTAKLTATLEQLQQFQLQLIQSEKMSALGQLVAGVAHEINNPIGFIKGNVTYAENYIQDLIEHIQYQQQATELEIAEHAAEIDLEYLLKDLPKIFASMKEASERITNISVSLRTFSRADSTAKVPFNIHDGIDSTILILKHRLKASNEHPDVEVMMNYGDLPLVECFPGQLNQVFMNILANAIDALEESNVGRSFSEIEASPNQIMIQTTMNNDGNWVLIRIKDNGVGMPDEIKQKAFEHLFTTKPVGKGTGLGLSIARQIIVEKHGGTLKVNSVLGKGSEFLITLPVKGEVSN